MKTLLAALAALALPAIGLAQSAPDYSASPIAAGQWTYQSVPGGSDARFIDSTAIIRLTVQCTKATRRVIISHTSSVPAASLYLWTSSASRALPARFEPKAMRVSAELVASDPLLDAIAFSRGRVVVVQAGMAPLVAPAWPEAARAIEDCRI